MLIVYTIDLGSDLIVVLGLGQHEPFTAYVIAQKSVVLTDTLWTYILALTTIKI